MKRISPFHYAFPVTNLDLARYFYVNTMQAEEARSHDRWVDFDFFGHQLSAHLVEGETKQSLPLTIVDGDHIPIPHFGLVLPKTAWVQLSDRLLKSKTKFILEPKLRFVDTPGEQWSMFLYDPFMNGIEFKSFECDEMLFKSS